MRSSGVDRKGTEGQGHSMGKSSIAGRQRWHSGVWKRTWVNGQRENSVVGMQDLVGGVKDYFFNLKSRKTRFAFQNRSSEVSVENGRPKAAS